MNLFSEANFLVGRFKRCVQMYDLHDISASVTKENSKVEREYSKTTNIHQKLLTTALVKRHAWHVKRFRTVTFTDLDQG